MIWFTILKMVLTDIYWWIGGKNHKRERVSSSGRKGSQEGIRRWPWGWRGCEELEYLSNWVTARDRLYGKINRIWVFKKAICKCDGWLQRNLKGLYSGLRLQLLHPKGVGSHAMESPGCSKRSAVCPQEHPTALAHASHCTLGLGEFTTPPSSQPSITNKDLPLAKGNEHAPPHLAQYAEF